MSAEILLTLIVALIVFGPNKLPMLARHLGKFIKLFNYYKIKIFLLLQQQLNEQQLEENKKKAESADITYLESK